MTFGATTSANGDYLYLYGYQGTNSDGAYYRAIVDGVLMNDKDGKAFVYTDGSDTGLSGVYEYTLTSDGLYQIKDRPANMVTGFITAKSGNGIIVNGVEYTLSDSTVIATIDGGDTSVGDSLSKNDYVTLVFDVSGDDKNVTGAFILETADDTNANILACTLEKSDADKVDYDADAGISLANLKKAFTVSKDATIYVVAADVDVDADAIEAGLTEVESIANGTNYQVVVVSADESDFTTVVVAVAAE